MAGNIKILTSNFWEKYDELITADRGQKAQNPMSDNITIYTIVTRFTRISSISV